MACDRRNIKGAGIPTTLSTTWHLVCTAVYAIALGGWLTHVIICAMEDRFLFLLAGAVFFPVAVIHGLVIWIT